MEFREIAFGSEAFRDEIALRLEILRHPLGLDFSEEELSAERKQRHFGLFEGEALVACIVAVPQTATSVKLRQMAVSSASQRQGTGRRIMVDLENLLAREGVMHVSLHARISAAGFYEKLGYECVGGEFVEVGIPHVKMEKSLEM